jgi:AraC family transcriptional regulator
MASSKSNSEIRTAYTGIADAPTVFVQVLSNSTLYITRERCDSANFGLTPESVQMDAFAIYIQLRNSFDGSDLWMNGKRTPRGQYSRGSVVAFPLDQRWRGNMREAFDILHVHLPRSALNDVANEIGVQPVGTLRLPPSENTCDPVVYGLATSLLPALQNEARASALFVESVALALSVHLCEQYGGMNINMRSVRGGLAHWQLKRAQELLLARLDGEISLDELASDCKLSRSHFARAFKLSMGMAPHQWLRLQRVEKAKVLLENSGLSLLEVALACGFVDYSHFSRVFTRDIALTPSQFRKQRGRAPDKSAEAPLS